MSVNDHSQVALFIDWDNLAISTAADLGGASPDIRAIVQRAQQYGTIIVARAYAEWTASSDRLSVYRSGIEPVYAPTFRFEPDTATSAGKGKSLADPCMVADFVDTLHLMPDIRTYVLVTGDKDMIPVVRLAQIRGRRVVVIGPDYVAGVLREMADEFISYRSLVDLAPRLAPEHPRRLTTHAPASEETRRRGGTDRRSAFARQEKLMAPPPILATAAPSVPTIPQPIQLQPVQSRAKPETPEAPELAEQPVPVDDLRSIYATIIELLRQRHEEGRDRIRATNLKDSLMQRMPGFSERRYGFAKFKDLLTAAEKSGLVDVTVAGPVHWISLPEVAEKLKPATLETPPPAVSEQEPIEAPVQLEERRAEMIRFVNELRSRSRWLTYTYVLTNLISHFGKSLSQAAAESQARATLNYLVQEGVLRVDKEPQEVEVGGAKHRVRMCHLNTQHELVIEALGVISGDAAQPEEVAEGTPPAIGLATGLDVSAGDRREQEGTPAEASSSTEAHRADRAHAEAVIGGNGSFGSAPGAPSAEESAPIVGPDHEPQAAVEALPPSQQEHAGSQMAAPDEAASKAPAEGEAASRLQQAYSALQQVTREAASNGKNVMSASSVRGRLSIALGGFNERQLGFPRFKDFLDAAENAGIVHTVTRGHVTWVSPVEGEQSEPTNGH